MHRLPTEEVFHFYLGGPVRMLQLFPDGNGREVLIGADILAGQQPQVVVPPGVWQGSRLEPGVEFALLGATMAPGFDYADYEQGRRGELSAQYPEYADDHPGSHPAAVSYSTWHAIGECSTASAIRVNHVQDTKRGCRPGESGGLPFRVLRVFRG